MIAIDRINQNEDSYDDILDLLNVESFRIDCFEVSITSFCVLPLLNMKIQTQKFDENT